MIRGQRVVSAINSLRFLNKAGAREFFKLLVSAIANAENKSQVDVDRLVVSQVMVDEGPCLKRWRPRAMGRANRINKKTSMIFVEVTEAAGN
jgi:large subunit ribosomal protein L22